MKTIFLKDALSRAQLWEKYEPLKVAAAVPAGIWNYFQPRWRLSASRCVKVCFSGCDVQLQRRNSRPRRFGRETGSHSGWHLDTLLQPPSLPCHRPGLRPTRGTVNVRPALVSCQGPCWGTALDLQLDHMWDHLSPLRRTVPSPCPARRNAAPPDETRSGRGGCTSGNSESRTRRIAISDEIMPLQK